jgi:tetratricopeptide (TPR) repeat protein
MKLRINRAYFRRRRGDIAALTVVVSFWFGIVLMFVGLYWMIDLFEATRWGDRPNSGGSICFVATFGEALILFSILLYTYSRSTIIFIAKLGHGLLAYQQGRYVEADYHAREAWQYAELLAPDDPFRGRVLEQLCCTSRLLGNYDDAEQFGLQWISAEERSWGKGDSHSTAAVLEVAAMYLDIARYSQVKSLLQEKIVALNLDPEQNPQVVALCQILMARMWSDLDHDNEAHACALRAFEIVRKHPEQTSKIALQAILDFAVGCAILGKLDEAEAIMRAEYKLIRQKVAPRAWQIAYCMICFARLRYCQERYAEAEKLNREALAIVSDLYKSNGPWQCTLWHGLANSLAMQEKSAEADACYGMALVMCDEVYAPEHPYIARLLEDYADLLERLGRYEEARQHQHHAQQIRDFHSPFRIL